MNSTTASHRRAVERASLRPVTASTRVRAWLRSAPSRLLRASLQDFLLLPAVRAWCTRYRVTGVDALQADRGPFLLVGNHASHLDAPAILAALPRHLRHRTAIAAAEDYFYRQALVGQLVSLGVGTFPFPRHGDVGLERAVALLDDGWNVLLFPEGTRSANGDIQRFRCGVGRLVARARVAVVPVAVVGTHAMWPKGRRLPRRGPVEIRFGAAWLPEAERDPRMVADELAGQVAALKAAPVQPAAAPVALLC